MISGGKWQKICRLSPDYFARFIAVHPQTKTTRNNYYIICVIKQANIEYYVVNRYFAFL